MMKSSVLQLVACFVMQIDCLYAAPPGCGGQFSSSSGTIRHPLHGGNYGNNEDCIWTINTAVPIKLTFSRFNSENVYDFLSIRDGENTESALAGFITGDESPSSVQIRTNIAYLHFRSDHSQTSTGFELQWEPSGVDPSITQPSTDPTTRQPPTTEVSDPPTTQTPTTDVTDPPTATPVDCPDGMFSVSTSNQCFRLIWEKMSWSSARARCASEGLVLARPDDSIAVALRRYIVDTNGYCYSVWVDARGTGHSISWLLDGSPLRPDLLVPYAESSVETHHCLALEMSWLAVGFDPLTPYHVVPCASTWPYVLCQEPTTTTTGVFESESGITADIPTELSPQSTEASTYTGITEQPGITRDIPTELYPRRTTAPDRIARTC